MPQHQAIAQTAQDFKEKYSRKHITTKTAPKIFLYNFVYWAYLTDERKAVDFQRDIVIANEQKAYSIIFSDMEPERRFRFYCSLCRWINTTFDGTVFIRNALNEFLVNYNNIASDVTIAEHLRQELGDQASNKKVAKWLNMLTLENFRPDKPRYNQLVGLRYSMRAMIETYTKYINAYNSLVSLIGNVIDVPELTIFQVDTETVETLLYQLNNSLEELRDIIKKQEVRTKTKAGAYTKAEMEKMLLAFDPVEEAPPIPEENIAEAKSAFIDGMRTTDIFDGDRLIDILKKNYWRR